ncbi:MAG: hypothetical protein ACM3PS_12070 [Syntrophothermus sp.]
MNKLGRFLNKVLAVLVLIVIVFALYLLLARPYQLHWGATPEDIQRSMPGDELDSAPTFLATRAITIEGTPEEIWPWLIQMGYNRAGFYGYDILENLGSSTGMLSADRILPEFQDLAVGNEVPISSVAKMTFYAIEPGQYLVWAGNENSAPGGFTWALYPIDASHTRLVSRIRWSHHWTEPSLIGLDLFTEFTDHLAVRKILQGVKGRVEGQVEPMMQGNIEFLIYLASLLAFLGSILWMLIRPLTWKGWLAGLAAGVAWLITWYSPISIWIGLVLEILVIWNLIATFSRSSTAHRVS